MLRNLNVEYIKKLWTLELVVQQGSLKRAATKANVSASAVSQAISSLERTCGKPLLIRRRGSALPTHEALTLLQAVRPAFKIFDEIHTGALPAEIPNMSSLDLGTYESIAIDVLPRLTARLHSVLPKLRLALKISRTGNLLSMVRTGELCMALITETENLDRFYCRKVAEDRLGFYVSNRHPIQKLGWKAVRENGLGILTPGPRGFPRYMNRFLRQVSAVKPYLKSDSFETLRACAAEGQLVSVLPERVAARAPDLCEIYPDDRAPNSTLGRHDLLLVSQSSCEREEVDFLADEIGKILV